MQEINTLDRPFVVYESLCFPSRDLEIPVLGLDLFQQKKKIETAVMNCVRRSC